MIHVEVLPEEQRVCLRTVGPAATALGFHLAGGTAVALHLGHRRSIDFDWFTGRFPVAAVDVSDSLRHLGVDLETISLAGGTVHGRVAGVRVSFLEFRPPLLEPTVDWPEYGCRLASCPDLAAMKLLAVAQRGTKKDFVDVHALSRSLPLEAMLDCYCRRFRVTDTARVLAGLSYFDSAETDLMPVMLRPLDWDRIRYDIREMVRRIARPS